MVMKISWKDKADKPQAAVKIALSTKRDRREATHASTALIPQETSTPNIRLANREEELGTKLTKADEGQVRAQQTSATPDTRPKRLHSNARRLTDKSLRDDFNLRNVFRDAPKLLDAISGDREASRTLERLISDGCAPEFLLSLVQSCVWGDLVTGLHKKVLDALKDQLDRIIRSLEALKTDVVSLGATWIGGDPLQSSIAFDSIDARMQTRFARHYLFIELPGTLTCAKALLTELKQVISEEHSVRNHTSGRQVAWLYLYCSAATGRLVTYREIADLLNAGLIARGGEHLIGERTIGMRLTRFKNSAAAMSYENLESLMKDYVRSCPTGNPSLEDWFSSNGAVWVSSHTKPMVPGRVISEKERRRLKLTEREHPKK
jgi:hypothetical protein